MTTAKLYLIPSLTTLLSNLHIHKLYRQQLGATSQQLAHVGLLHTRQLLLGYLDKREKLLPVLSIGMLRLCRWALVRLWVNMLPRIWVWNCRRVTYLPRRPTWWRLLSFVGMLRQPRFVPPIWRILLQMQYHWQRSKFHRSHVLKTTCYMLRPCWTCQRHRWWLRRALRSLFQCNQLSVFRRVRPVHASLEASPSKLVRSTTRGATPDTSSEASLAVNHRRSNCFNSTTA